LRCPGSSIPEPSSTFAFEAIHQDGVHVLWGETLGHRLFFSYDTFTAADVTSRTYGYSNIKGLGNQYVPVSEAFDIMPILVSLPLESLTAIVTTVLRPGSRPNLVSRCKQVRPSIDFWREEFQLVWPESPLLGDLSRPNVYSTFFAFA
jgi:hypothetical protein